MKEKIIKSKLLPLIKKATDIDGEIEIIDNKFTCSFGGVIPQQKEQNDIIKGIAKSLEELNSKFDLFKDEIKNDIKSVKNVVILVNNKLDDVIGTNNLKLSKEHKQWSFKDNDNPDNKNNPTR